MTFVLLGGTVDVQTRHHRGDGCAGQRRVLSNREHAEVHTIATHLLNMAAEGRIWAVVTCGSHLGRHYGPDAEWILTARCARLILDGTNDGHLYPSRFLMDSRFTDLMVALIAQQPKRVTEVESGLLTNASQKAARYLATFLDHMRQGHYAIAHALWLHIFDSENDQDTGAAFLALMITWTATIGT